VPKANVRAFELVLLNERIVSVKLFSVTVPVVNVNAPVNAGEPERLRLMSLLLTVQVDVAAVAATVTVAAVPLLASNVTVSAVVGADAPAAPPDVADQFAVELLSHVPEPPTQNLAAIMRSYP
jgi:hypothetical protein